MTKYTCKACGVQQASTHVLPNTCPICEDDRQDVLETGQQWLILPEHHNKHKAEWVKVETNVHRLPTSFECGIGQDAYFINTANGNYLWDCVPLVCDEWVDKIMAYGGLKAIVISHPHFYANVADWSAIFGNIPIYIHYNDQQWVQEISDNIIFWRGDELPLEADLTIINCGGHFDGSCVLHWRGAADGKAIVFAGDSINPIGGADTKNVTFMHSFSKRIPLPAHKVETIVQRMLGFKYDRLYGAFGSHVLADAHSIVQHCADRYIQALK